MLTLCYQVYSSLTWVLARVTASYLMPSEHKYTFIPRSLLLAFGEEGETGKEHTLEISLCYEPFFTSPKVHLT